MKFSDTVTILRPSGADEYGNPGTSWASPTEIAAVGYMQGDTCYFPAGTDVQRGDRLQVAGVTYDVQGDPRELRSPTRAFFVAVKVEMRRS